MTVMEHTFLHSTAKKEQIMIILKWAVDYA